MSLDVFKNLVNLSGTIVPMLVRETAYAAVVFGLIWLIIKIFRIKSPRWHYALWLLVLIRLIIPPDFSHSLSLRSALDRLPGDLSWEILIDHFTWNHNLDTRLPNDYQGISVDDSENLGKQPDGFAASSILKKSIYTTLFIAWIFGMFVFFVFYVKKIKEFRGVIKRSYPIQDYAITKFVRKRIQILNISRKIKVLSSEEYLSPFTIGIFKPVIYLPQSVVSSGNKDYLQSIIAHELSHIKRLDSLWIRLQSLLQIAYFFNPVIWIVNSKISLSRECLCDMMVLSKKKISTRKYGQGIMTVLNLNLFGANEINVLPGFGSERKRLIYRIKNLTGEMKMGKYQSKIMYVVIILLGIFLLPIAGGVISNSDQNATETLVAKELSPSEDESAEFVLPIKVGRISAGFGKMKHPYTKKVMHHKGIDIAAKKGTEIFASSEGKVSVAVSDYKKNKGPGKYIVIQHEKNYETFYSHLDEVLVKEGQKIKAGDLIAKVGTTGLSTGPHLHFEIRKNGKAHDPKEYVDFDKLIQKIEKIK